MFRYIRTSQVPLTESLAAEFATMPPHKGERPLRQQHVDWLSGKIEAGLFHPPRWAKAKLKGKTYRVNGQHSSTALAQANGHFPKGLEVLIDEFECDTDDDVADLFAQFDPAGSVRTPTEVLMAGARQHAELANLSAAAVKHAVQAIVSLMQHTGDASGRVPVEAKRGIVSDNIPFILWTTQFTGASRMRTSGVLPALAATYKKNPDAATEFWKMVREESHPQVDHPTRKLGRFLALIVNGQEFNKKKGKPWTPRAVFVKCIHAWNAYRKGVTTDMSYFEESDIPELVK
jgi:hypothetical protein